MEITRWRARCAKIGRFRAPSLSGGSGSTAYADNFFILFSNILYLPQGGAVFSFHGRCAGARRGACKLLVRERGKSGEWNLN